TRAEAERFQRYFQKHGRYTAGVETRYDPSIITSGDSTQALASGLIVGTRFHSSPVIRLADAKRLELGHVLKADGRWRLLAFAPTGDRGRPDGAVAELCSGLIDDQDSPVRRYTADGADIDAVIDVRAVFQAGHRDLAIEDMPALLLPATGRLGLTDYEKIFCPDLRHGPDIFDHRGIDRRRGALVVVRPDQFVAAVLPLGDGRTLGALFDRFMTPVGSGCAGADRRWARVRAGGSRPRRRRRRRGSRCRPGWCRSPGHGRSS
ncbi:MAG: hypothetical protein ACR2QO_22085, partial [Acidimicrobiales bacterium]